MAKQKKQVELDVQEVPEVRTPINYRELCTMVGELYVESYVKVTSINRRAGAAEEEHRAIVTDLQSQLTDLQTQLKELEALSAGGGNESD